MELFKIARHGSQCRAERVYDFVQREIAAGHLPSTASCRFGVASLTSDHHAQDACSRSVEWRGTRNQTMDKRAKQVLFDAFWSTHGWKREVLRIPPGDFEYAKARRVMFEPLLATHDETIKRLSAVVSSVSLRQVVDGFLASLSTRRLDWRSALGSYSVAFWLPIHEATPDERQCRVCGLYSGKQEQDLNVLNFERLKWGGVRHSNPTYELLDLELFMEEPPSAPTVNDFEIFRSLICAIEKVPPSTTSAELHKWLPSELRSNKAERDQLIAILGLCGILDTPEHPGFGRQFVPHAGRTLPERRFVDMAYPACWWSGSLGLNRELLLERFGHAL